MVSTAARVGSINVLLSTQLGPGMAGLNAFAGAVDRTGASVSRSVAGIDRSVGGLNRSMGNINTRGMTSLTLGALRAGTAINQLQGIALAAGVAVGGLFPAAVAAGMIRTVDGAHRLSNQLRTVTNDADDLKNTQQALYEVAQRSRSSFDGTVTIYARTARAVEHLNMKQKDLLRMTETVQKAFSVGGATAAEAWGGAVQLSQGIASNRFSGDEFRSVAENAPVLLRGMANALGVNIGKLREMAHAGQLTASVVTKAIIDASSEIDDAFAKTTSTIEQAWTRVGNAVTKYAMDSENAAAGSRAIVGGLNLMADNISGLVDVVVALGAVLTATFAARRMQAVTGWVSGLKAARIETLALAQSNQLLAQAQMQAARADFLQKRLAFNAALNAGTLSAKQLERQKKALAASSVAYRNATQAATAATAQLSTAQKAASVAGMSMAAAGRVVSAAWAFIGGPFGAAMLAVGAAWYLSSRQAAAAEERARLFESAIRDAGGAARNSANDIKEAAGALDLVAKAATEAERRVNLLTAQQALQALGIEATTTIQKLGALNGWQSVEIQGQLKQLWDEFITGQKTLEAFLRETDGLSGIDPDTDKITAALQDIARRAVAAMAAIGLLKQEVSTLDGVKTTPKTGRQLPLGDDDFNSRFGGRYADPWKKLFPDLYKDPKKGSTPKKTADDRFDNSVQAIYDRIEALRLEREILGATFYEQTKREEALKLEQEALKQAREEARRKGDADWQNAQISKEKRAEIEKVTTALAAEADAHRKATEAMEFQKDIMKDVMSGIREALADGKITWEEIGQVATRVLDKIINKIEDELIDAIFRMNQAGASGGGGGGIFGFLGGLLGLGGGVKLPGTAPIPTPRPIMDSGGAMLASGLVPFGPKTRMLQADSGFGPRNFLAVLEEGESVLTDNLMDRTMGVVSAATDAIKDGGRASRLLVEIVVNDDGTLGAIAQQAGGQAAEVIVREYDKGRQARLAADLPELRRRGVA